MADTVNGVTLYTDETGRRQAIPTALLDAVRGSGASAGVADMLYQQFSAAQLASVQRFAPPTGAKMARVQSNGGSAVRYRGDGTDPTPMIGMLLEPGESHDFTGDLTHVAFIDQGANAVLDVTYYG